MPPGRTAAAKLLILAGALLLPAVVRAQPCPANSVGTGNGAVCVCVDGYTGVLADAGDPASGAQSLVYDGPNSAYIGSCSPCADGYAGTTGSCAECAAGEYQDGTSLTACQTCAPGSIAPDAGTGTCAPCPAGEKTLTSGGAHSRTECNDCIFGQYSTGGAAECTSCAAGTVGAGIALTSCTNCPNGRHQTIEGHVLCDACPEGTFAEESTPSPECTPCPVGEYQPTGEQASCITCPLGSQTEDSSAGWVGSGAVACDVCEVGKSLGLNVNQHAVGFAGCVDCAAGQSQPQEEQTSCIPCVAGKYQPTEGNADCIDCAAGSQTEDALTVGAAGGDFTDSGAVGCRGCELGRSAGADGQGNPDPTLACALCGTGRYQDELGQTSCKGCQPGTVVDAQGSDGALDCVACGVGEYQPQEGQATCLSDCSAGRNTVGLGSCTQTAQPGNSQDAQRCAAVVGEELVSPTVCEAVTTADNSGALACTYTYGTFSNAGEHDRLQPRFYRRAVFLTPTTSPLQGPRTAPAAGRASTARTPPARPPAWNAIRGSRRPRRGRPLAPRAARGGTSPRPASRSVTPAPPAPRPRMARTRTPPARTRTPGRTAARLPVRSAGSGSRAQTRSSPAPSAARATIRQVAR